MAFNQVNLIQELIIKLTINITIQRSVTLKGWHECKNNSCENQVFGNKSVCLKCWVLHNESHVDPLPRIQSKYFINKK